MRFVIPNSSAAWAALFLVVFGAVAVFVTSPQISPTGDEPHYLIAAHSIAFDHDISLANNYRRRHYRVFYPPELAKRTTLSPEKRQIPAFGIGLSVFLSPFYWLGLRFFPTFLVPFLRLVMCSITGIALFHLMTLAQSIGNNPPNRLVILGAVLASPLLTYSSLFYPEIVAFLLLVIALRRMHEMEQHPWKALVWLCIISPSLIWLHPKYLALGVLTFLLSAGFFHRLRSRHRERRFAVIQTLHFLLTLAGIAGFFLFLHSNYGSWSPNRIYGGEQKGMSLLALISKLGVERSWVMLRMFLGWWLDERFGLIVYAPLYLAFFPAFVWFLKNDRCGLRIPVGVLFIGHYLVISWAAQMGGYAPPSRHLVVLLPLILLPVMLVSAYWTRRQRILFAVLEGFGWLISTLILTHYRLVFSDTTWRNPDGKSVFWEWLHLERWIPSLTATQLEYGLISCWIIAAAALSFLFYPGLLEGLKRKR